MWDHVGWVHAAGSTEDIEPATTDTHVGRPYAIVDFDIMALFSWGKKRTLDVRQLRDQAADAVGRSKPRKALKLYAELEKREPAQADWPRRAAECYRALGEQDAQIAALSRAAELYAQSGFLLKGIALCKVILNLDSEHTETLERLADLESLRFGRPCPAPAAGSVRPARLDGAPLEELTLNEMMPSVCQPAPPNSIGRVFDISLEEAEEQVADFEPPATEPVSQPDAERAAAQRAVQATPLFSDLDAGSLKRLIQQVCWRRVSAGDSIFEQGEPADALYVIAEGAVSVVAQDEASHELARLGEGDFFGELGLLSSQPRIASVRAVVDTELLSISPGVLSILVDHDPSVLKVLLRFLRDRLIGRLVLTSQLFAPFSQADRDALAGRFRFLEVESDTELITRGTKVDGLYILLTGTAVVRTDIDVATLGRGDLFGEMSLLSQHSALATVRTTSKCFALKLPAQDFRQAIMTHPPLLAYVSSIAAAREKQNAELAGERDYSDGRLELL